MSIAEQYFSLGWRVTPLLGKKPFLENWQNSRLNPEEFKKYGDCNVGVITGWVNDKLAVCALDVDEPLLIGFNPQPWLDKGAMAHTTSNAPRIVFYTDSPEVAGFSRKVAVTPSDLTEAQKKLVTKGREKQNITVIEILAEGRQFMAPPSKHPDTGKALEWIVPPKPPEQSLVIHRLAELKRLLEESISQKWVIEELFETAKSIAENKLLQKWLEQIKQHLRVEGEGSQYIYCHCPFHPPDAHPSFAINKVKFYAVDYHTGEVYNLKQLAEKLGVELEGAKTGEGEEEERVVRVCFAELSDGRLIEQAFNGEKTFFLVYNPKTDSVEKAGSVEDNGVVYKPIESPELHHKTVLLPSDVEEYGSEETLAKEVLEFLDRWHEPPDFTSRVLDVNYCFLTHIQDLIPQLPYRRTLASWGKGKSAWIDALGSICYRPVLLAGSDTDKSIVRRMHLWRGTYLIDEADFANSNLYSFVIKILNIGFDRRKGWYYRCDEDNPKRVLGYYVYGAKLLATRSRYRDVALESRCLTTIGRENSKPVPLFRMERFEEEAQRLRNKLILWRFRNYYRVKEEAKKLEQPEIAEKLYDGADRVSSRVKQVILPLWLVMGEQMREQLVALAKTFDERLKAEDSEYLLELETREAVARLVENNQEGVKVVKVLNVLYMREGREEEFYSIQLSVLSREVLKLRGVKEEDVTVKDVTSVSKNLSKLFESRLGFAIKVGKARKREVLIPVEWVKAEKIVELEDFFEEGGSHNKDVQNVHFVHPGEAASAEGSTAVLTEENVKRVWNALVEASRERGSAHISEVVLLSGLPRETVEAVLKVLEREGKAYQPYPEWWKPVL